MKGNRGRQIGNPKVTVPRTYQDKAHTLSDDPGTSFALWRLYLTLREIAQNKKNSTEKDDSPHE